MDTAEPYGPLLTVEQAQYLQRELERQKREALATHERWLEGEIVSHRRDLEWALNRLAKLKAGR